MPFNGSGSAFFVPDSLAYAALPIARRSRIGVFRGVFMPSIAVGFAEIGAHGKALVKDTTLWIKQFIKRFAMLGSFHQGVCFEAGYFGKHRGFIRNALNRYETGVSLVKRLLFSGGPPAIFGRIWTIIVDSLNGKPIRARPYVLNEGGKAFLPAFTNSNPSTAIG